MLNTKDVVFDGPRDPGKAKVKAGVSAFEGPPLDVNMQAGVTENLTLDESSTNAAPTNAVAEPDWETLPYPVSDIGAVPAFDAPSGAWYVKADSDDIAFNDTDTNSNYRADDPAQIEMPGNDMYARAARRSHYYKYLLRVDGTQVQVRNTLEIAATLPDRLKAYPVKISAVQVRLVGDGCVAFSRPWMEFVYPWQAPSLDNVVDPEQGLPLSPAPANTSQPPSRSTALTR